MANFARHIASLGPLHQFLFLFAFLAVVWALTRIFFPRLRPYSGQILVLASIFWMGALFEFLTLSFPKPRGLMVSPTDAGTIPGVWFAALVPFVLLTLQPMISAQEKPDMPWGNLKLVMCVLVTIVSSIVLFDILGYYLSSALFIFIIMRLLKSRDKVQLIAVPVGWVIFTYWVFGRLLSVSLPAGRLFSFLN